MGEFDNIVGAGFGLQVRSQRIRRGMTQRQLADLASVGLRTIRELESGRTDHPHPVTVRLLAQVLGIPARTLAARTPSGDGHDAERPDGAQRAPIYPGETVGREELIATACELVAKGYRRIALTGIAGVGKTRVAAAVAGQVRTELDIGVQWFELKSSGSADPLLSDAAGAGRRLAVFDNLAAAEHAARIDALLDRRAELSVLVTSRRPVQLPDCVTLYVPPLSLSDQSAEVIGMLDDTAAIQLLLTYVQVLRPGFRLDAANVAVISELCRRLDGIPVLLESAARALLLLDPAEVLETLELDPVAALSAIAPEFLAESRRTLAGLDESALAMLREVALLPAGWTVGEAADRLGLPRLLLTPQVRTLLELGLVRAASADCHTRFQVLESLQALVAC